MARVFAEFFLSFFSLGSPVEFAEKASLQEKRGRLLLHMAEDLRKPRKSAGSAETSALSLNPLRRRLCRLVNLPADARGVVVRGYIGVRREFAGSAVWRA